MKKFATIILSLTIISNCCISASAQKVAFRLGPQIGLHLTTNSLKINQEKAEVRPRLGLHTGLITELGIGNFFAIQPSVLFSMSGFSMGESTTLKKGTAYFVDVPIHFVGRYDFGPTALFIHVGSSFNFGLGGTIKDTYASGIIHKYSYFDSERGFKRFGLDLNMGLGVELNDAFQIDLHYGLGLMNISQQNDSQWKQGAFMLSFSWLFQTKKQ